MPRGLSSVDMIAKTLYHGAALLLKLKAEFNHNLNSDISFLSVLKCKWKQDNHLKKTYFMVLFVQWLFRTILELIRWEEHGC